MSGKDIFWVFSNLKSLVIFLCLSSDEDLIFLGEASMGMIETISKRKKEYSKKKLLEQI